MSTARILMLAAGLGVTLGACRSGPWPAKAGRAFVQEAFVQEAAPIRRLTLAYQSNLLGEIEPRG